MTSKKKEDPAPKTRARKHQKSLQDKLAGILRPLQDLVALVADGESGEVEFASFSTKMVYPRGDKEHVLRIRQGGRGKPKKNPAPLAAFAASLRPDSISLSFSTKRATLDFLSALTSLSGLVIFALLMASGKIGGIGGGGFSMPRPDVGDDAFMEAIRKASEAMNPQPTQDDPEPEDGLKIDLPTGGLEDLLEKLRKGGFPMPSGATGFA